MTHFSSHKPSEEKDKGSIDYSSCLKIHILLLNSINKNLELINITPNYYSYLVSLMIT